MTTFNPKPGDEVVDRQNRALGTGIFVEKVLNPTFPSIPTGRAHVRFGHITRSCVIGNLVEPARMRFGGHETRLVVVGGDAA